MKSLQRSLREAPAGEEDLELDKLIRLFTHQDTAKLSRRQVNVLLRLCKQRAEGFSYKDISYVEKLLPLVLARLEED
ncbi:unnamed protein product, partial [Chrysoparadoxa australica]